MPGSPQRTHALTIIEAGPDTKLLSSLCAACPHSPAGCCVAPPRLDWSDVGRIVASGGRNWLLEELAANRMSVGAAWLFVARPKRPLGPGGPKEAACVYHGHSGCTIPHDRRSATCNYYLCDEAQKGELEARARAVHDSLMNRFVSWDAELVKRVFERWPEGPPMNAEFLDWLGEEFSTMV